MKLWVIKIGTSILRGSDEFSTEETIRRLCHYVSNFISKGNKLILVTSGAVGLGCKKLNLNQRPKELTSLQAIAAVGQVNLMKLYDDEMQRLGLNIAQILLTKSDFNTRESFNNASKTLMKLLSLDVIPIVNENDTTSNEELKYGDNDTLSALVALAIKANRLILLTDTESLYSKDPRTNFDATPITEVHSKRELNEIKDINQSNKNNEWGTGGITTKLLAAEMATKGGITVQLADGRTNDNLKHLFNEQETGTVFHSCPKPVGSKKSWLAHAIQTVGSIVLDNGACDAIETKGASLLIVGIIEVEGEFKANEPIRILNKEKKEVAKGITSLSSQSIRKELSDTKSKSHSRIVVHRDALALSN